MFFQISPVAKRKPKPKANNEVEVNVVSLAPFTSNAVIEFQNIEVGTTTLRKLLIQNPTNHDVNVVINMNFPKEIVVGFSWHQQSLAKHSELGLDIFWAPQSELSARYSFSIEDPAKRLRKDVAVVFKSVQNQKKAKPLSKKRKSPIAFKVSPKKRVSPQRNSKTTIPRVLIHPPENKENVPQLKRHNRAAQFFKSPNYDYQMRRETYTINKNDLQPVFDDSLEEPKNITFNKPKPGILTPTQSPNLASYAYSHGLKNTSSLLSKLQTDSFTFTPPNQSKLEFHCSTDEKTKSICELFSENVINTLNFSSETYVKSNNSFETYVKGNVSCSTYTKDTSIGDLRSLELSPVAESPNITPLLPKPSPRHLDLSGDSLRHSIEASLWSNESLVTKPKKLSVINEVSFLGTDRQLKRKLISEPRSPSPFKKPHLVNDSLRHWSVIGKTGGITKAVRKSDLSLAQFFSRASISKVAPIPIEETNSVIVENPFILAATNLIDPFMTADLYANEEWVEEQQVNFKKWINALVAPPAEFKTNLDEGPVDVAKVWKECKEKAAVLPGSKELVSKQFNVSNKLNSLRKSAQALYRSANICSVLSKVTDSVERGKLEIRADKDVHLNIALKSQLLKLILSYNSLWLRIALETVYNELIPMSSNSDVASLTEFIVERLFKDPKLVRKHKSIHANKYGPELKRFFLKKFLILVYFLDQAKNAKLISHDPCLFRKKSPIKETREVLVQLSCETLHAIGDIIKYLKSLGYIVTYKQSYIHEFNYAVSNLAGDLRDGVRLVKIMEIILEEGDLTSLLRVPAISRLQKIHNVKIVFDSLQRAGFQILYDIEAKDIVNGHKEKTLSFLWQIIYKFQAPLMVKSATRIQVWYRSLPVVLKRRRLERLRLKREAAASRIQLWYRRVKFAWLIELFAEVYRRHLAALRIQTFYRMARCRRRFLQVRRAIIGVQSFARLWLVKNHYRKRIVAAKTIQKNYRMVACRREYLRLRDVVVKVQARYRAKLAMRVCRDYYGRLRKAAVCLQSNYRAKKAFESYRRLKAAVILVQTKYRALRSMQKERTFYLRKKIAAVRIQTWFRGVLATRKCVADLQLMKKSVRIVEERFIAKKLMDEERRKFVAKRQACVTLQRVYRGLLQMRVIRNYFIALRLSVKVVETRYIAQKKMQLAKNDYNKLKSATLLLQNKFRALISMRKARQNYLALKSATIFVQRRFIANKLCKIQRDNYVRLKCSAVFIQTKFRAMQLMRIDRATYQRQRNAAITIQNWYGASLLMKALRAKFLGLKEAVHVVEERYIALKLMRESRSYYIRLRRAAIKCQRIYRAKKLMDVCKGEYQEVLQATRVIQARFRAQILMRVERNRYQKLREAAILVQVKYRAQVLMREDYNYFNNLKRCTIEVQMKFRATKLMRQQRAEFLALKKATVLVQERFRAQRAMKIERRNYLRLRYASWIIQQKFRAHCAFKLQFVHYTQLKKATIVVQQRYRAQKLMIAQRKRFVALREAAQVLQRRFRAQRFMKIERSNYEGLKAAALIVQRRFRAQVAFRAQYNDYTQLKKAALIIQRRYRAQKSMIEERNKFRALKAAVIVLQGRFRAQKAMKIERNNYNNLKTAVLLVQRIFRALLAFRAQYFNYNQLKKAALLIQNRYRAQKSMIEERNKFRALKEAAIVLQRRFRAQKAMKIQRNNYKNLQSATLVIQQRYRAQVAFKAQFDSFTQLKKATLTIQRRYRTQKSMIRERNNFQALKAAAIVLQSRYRAQTLMKSELQNYRALRKYTIVIQEKFRAQCAMKLAHHAFQTQKRAATLIQAHFRAFILKRNQHNYYLSLKTSVTFVQRLYRANKAKTIDCNNFRQLKAAALVIQRRYRAQKMMQIQRASYVTICKSVCKLQALTRGFLVRHKYKGYFSPEARAERIRFAIETKAATKLQSFWRGFRIRKVANTILEQIRRRAKLANQRAKDGKSLSLGMRSQNALQLLVDDSSGLNQIQNALEDLEYVIRHSRLNCIKMSKLLPDQLYMFLKCTSRSLPEMNVCSAATKILIHFYKYERTSKASFLPEHVDKLFTIMMHWCDKEGSLFADLCTLVWLFAHDEASKKIILGMPNLHQRLMKIKELLLRKKKMVEIGGSNPKSYFAKYTKSTPMPMLRPDWGLYDKQPKTKPFTFGNSVQAGFALMKILDVSD